MARKRRQYCHQRVPEGADPWDWLPIWVFIRAVWDARGEHICGYRRVRDKELTIEAARDWLKSDAALIFLDRYNIDPAAISKAIGI